MSQLRKEYETLFCFQAKKYKNVLKRVKYGMHEMKEPRGMLLFHVWSKFKLLHLSRRYNPEM